MLSHLIIKNFILIEETCLPFNHKKIGLHILTGEAGAGKSIILQALQGVFGHRLITKNSQSLALDETQPIHLQALCYSNQVIHDWLLTQKLPLIHQVKHQLVVERMITFSKNKTGSTGSKSVKNKYLINGVNATSEQTQHLGSLLMLFQGQHAQQVLLDATQHSSLFDECTELKDLQQEVSITATKFLEHQKKIHLFEQLQQQYERDKEQLLWEQQLIQEIDAPLTGELWEQLNLQQKQLQAQVKLQATLQNNYQRIQNIYSSDNVDNLENLDTSGYGSYTDDISGISGYKKSKYSVKNNVSIAQKVQQIHDDLKHVQKDYLWLDPILQHLEEISIHLEEVDYQFAHQLQHIHIDGDELQSVEQTIQKMWSVARKLKITPPFLQERFLENQQKLTLLKQQQNLVHLQQELKNLHAEYHEKALLLSDFRNTKKQELESIMQKLLYDLGLETALFRVVFINLNTNENDHDHNYSSVHKDGYEKTQFYFDAQGQQLQPLQNVASGGELSRIHLALCLSQNIILDTKNTKNSTNNTNTTTINQLLVFDEIDTGLSGEMAQKVGQILKKLGQHRQILCITHLPQVAGYADESIQIQKRNNENGEIRSFLKVLETEKERITALAGLLGGDKTTATQHAQNLLQ